jgi:Extensin-like protein C-terminus
MAVAPLPPVWTAASRTSGLVHHRPGVSVELGVGVGIGGLEVRKGARRSGRKCLRELVRLGIPFKRAPRTRGVDTPVIVTGPVRGLKLSPMWGKRPALMDCIFALSFYRMAPVVLRSGVNELLYSSVYSYRKVAGTNVLSRHSYGLAIDVFEVRGPGKARANVKKDWVKAVGRPGHCIGPVRSRKARLLRGLACNLEKSRILSLIMTPDTDYAHRDHFHMACLKASERRHHRVRYAGRPKGRTWIPGRAVRRPRRSRARRRRVARRLAARRLAARRLAARRRAARRRAGRRRAARRRAAKRHSARRPRPRPRRR